MHEKRIIKIYKEKINYIQEYERGGEYKTNEMNEYRNNYSNNDYRI